MVVFMNRSKARSGRTPAGRDDPMPKYVDVRRATIAAAVRKLAMPDRSR
jgi:hypothetical protein